MIELIKYFRILFLSVRISRERLQDFTEDHLQRLTANNPGGIFTTILTATTTAYNSYFGDLSSESLNLAVQQGKTIALNESREALLKNISENEKLIAYTYRNDSPVYEEFYPQGISEYYKATIAGLEYITQRYKDVLANHAADFTAGFVTDYNTLQATFVANRAAQQNAMGSVAAERSDLATSRTGLATQLTTNLLTIALHYLGDESKCDMYFNQGILNAAFDEADRKVVSNIDVLATLNVFDNITKPELSLMIKNTGSQPINIAFAATAATPVPNVPDTTIAPGEERGANAGEMGWSSTAKFLNITNYGDSIGSFDVRKV